MKLNIGCGEDIKQGYINIDIRKLYGVDLVIDLEKEKLPYEDNSVDEILAKDIIEHFSFIKVEEILKEWHRVLKPKGLLVIHTPDFEQIASKYYKGEIGDWYSLSFWLYGAQDYEENLHKCIFTKKELSNLLNQIGFEIVEIFNDNTNIICKAHKKV